MRRSKGEIRIITTRIWIKFTLLLTERRFLVCYGKVFMRTCLVPLGKCKKLDVAYSTTSSHISSL